MKSNQKRKAPSLPYAWGDLQANARGIDMLEPEANRLAFADPEFLLRRETRGIRFQLEMLKPDLAQIEAGIEHTLVVFGSARFVDRHTAQAQLQAANTSAQAQAIAKAHTMLRNAEYYENARIFAKLVANSCASLPDDEKLFICTGGGPGIMEAANRGAHDAGAPSIGFNITLPMEQEPNAYSTPDLTFRFHYFAMRKMHFAIRAAALVVFPGGFGTMDELFEILTLRQTGKMDDALPVVLYDSSFWKNLINFQHFVDSGMVSAKDLDLFGFADTPRAAWEQLVRRGLTRPGVE